MSHPTINNNAYKITQHGDYNYSLASKGEYKTLLYLSILKTDLLPTAFLDKQTNSIIFTGETVETLPSYLQTNKMSEAKCADLITHLTSQMKYLESTNHVLYGYDLCDILVINGNTFIAANSNYILPIENDTYFFHNPNIMPFFSSLELFNLTSLPSTVHYKSSYYSLGVLVVYCLLNKQLLEIMDDKMVNDILKPIFYSKTYWFVKRCLNPNCEQRVLLYI
jgi:hypothetical protein